MNYLETDQGKSIALKSQFDLSNEDLDEQELALLSKRISRMLQESRAKNLEKKKFQSGSSQDARTTYK